MTYIENLKIKISFTYYVKYLFLKILICQYYGKLKLYLKTIINFYLRYYTILLFNFCF